MDVTYHYTLCSSSHLGYGVFFFLLTTVNYYYVIQRQPAAGKTIYIYFHAPVYRSGEILIKPHASAPRRWGKHTQIVLLTSGLLTFAPRHLQVLDCLHNICSDCRRRFYRAKTQFRSKELIANLALFSCVGGISPRGFVAPQAKILLFLVPFSYRQSRRYHIITDKSTL